MEPTFISVSIAQIDCGLTRWGWKQFLKQTGLPVYRIPGNAYVVSRSELDQAIEKVREGVEPKALPESEQPR